MAEPRELRPIQVLLDTKQFIAVPDPQDFRGGKKDFFEDNDQGFVAHRDRIREKLRGISKSARSRKEPLTFLTVQMRETALAKSYRPLGSLFKNTNGFAHVGSQHVGEMIFQGTPDTIDRLERIIERKAEETPRLAPNKKTGELEKRVSGYRSEVGAIDDIRLHDRGDRLGFSTEEAVEWLGQPNVLGSYIVELFRPDPRVGGAAVVDARRNLTLALESLGGVSVHPFIPSQQNAEFGESSALLSVRLTGASGSDIELPFTPRAQTGERPLTPYDSRTAKPDLDKAKHQRLLTVLAEQSLVRSIELPPLIEASPAAIMHKESTLATPVPQAGADYPVVGIIDGGTADLPALAAWRVGDAGLVPLADRDESHGSFIAGLVVAAGVWNPHLADKLEATGCKFYDLDIIPRRDLRPTYYSDPEFFFDLLDEKIKAAKRDHGARIFNFSFAVTYRTSRPGYSPVADRLDRIARANDVILVISAGNLGQGDSRPVWPAKAPDAVQMLAGFGAREKRITPPAEHLLGLTVGAINPPSLTGHIADMPTTYTRRGPGVGGARKPDLAHYGGVEASSGGNRTGLASISASGATVENCGTSFAAPHVAATVATIDQRLARMASRELLMALPIHRARRPKALEHASLKHISREFVGFGITPPADAILMDDPYGITLVFSEKLLARQVLTFPFSWPQSLVTPEGGCRGRIDLTLVYTPPIDPDHREEAQRVQLEVGLRREDIDPESGEISMTSNELSHDSANLPKGMTATEKYRLMTGIKWAPIQRLYANMPNGRGTGSNWKLGLKSLVRAGAAYPDDGVPFSILLTISDPKRATPFHDELRNQLQATGLQIADITVAHRVRARG